LIKIFRFTLIRTINILQPYEFPYLQHLNNYSLKKTILIVLLSISLMRLFAQSEKSVKTIDLLQSYSGVENDLLVSDPIRGGNFHYVANSCVADGGVIFKALGRPSGYWIRTTGMEVYPEWWATATNSSRHSIQSALNYSSAYHKKTVLRRGLYQTDSSLILPSNTNLKISAGAIIRMNDGSDKPMFQNKNAIYKGSAIANADSNITISGKGIIAGGVQELSTRDSILNATISLNNVQNIHISGIRIDTTSTYAIFISSFKNIYISKVDIENRNMPYGRNDDGIHFSGPGKTAYVDGCTIRCTDDAIAILANEFRFRYKTNNGGDITDVHITNTKFNNAAFGIRFLASDANIYNCTVDNTTGTVLNRVLEFGNYGLKAAGGIMDRIAVNNTDVNVTSISHSKPIIYFNQGNYGTISLTNTTINGNQFSNSMIRIGNGEGATMVKNIVITNYKKVRVNQAPVYNRYILNTYLVFAACWALSLFYLTWLLITHTKISIKSERDRDILSAQFRTMEQTLWYYIATPLMLLSIVLCAAIIYINVHFNQTSLQIKLGITSCLTAYHFICLHIMNRLRKIQVSKGIVKPPGYKSK